MAITEMIIPGLRHGSGQVRYDDPNVETGTCTATWSAWGTTASVSVTDLAVLPAAQRIVSRAFAAAEKAAARYRRDAELHKLYRAGGREITVSPLLAELISAALIAAERTDGDVDPTVGAAMTAVHSGRRPGSRDTSGVPTCGSAPTTRPASGWQQVSLRGRRLQVPIGTTLDLSATAKAVACDRAAAAVRDRLHVGVLVVLGGNAASSGPAPDGGWNIAIEDRIGNRQTSVRLTSGSALATSHFTARPDGLRLAGQPEPQGHLIDPRTGRPPVQVWRMASAIAFTSLEAATYTAAALVRGTSAKEWLRQLWVPARLITTHDDEIFVGPWDAHLVGTDVAPDGITDPHITHTTHPARATDPQLPGPRVANPRRTTLG